MGRGKRIKKLRLELELSQINFGLELGVTQTTISHWETEHKAPSVTMVQKMVKFAKTKGIKISLDEIFGE